jgi:hypothetical protein
MNRTKMLTTTTFILGVDLYPQHSLSGEGAGGPNYNEGADTLDNLSTS